jgi:hypothetical protein
LDFTGLDLFEVQVFNDEEGPKLVSAIELVSPANKDRRAHRHAFAIKCASYLQDGVNVMIVDVVTERHANLHAELLNLLSLNISTPALGKQELYAATYRPILTVEQDRLELWIEPLAIGATLPTQPLWLSQELALPLNLEQTYEAACVARRIDVR